MFLPFSLSLGKVIVRLQLLCHFLAQCSLIKETGFRIWVVSLIVNADTKKSLRFLPWLRCLGPGNYFPKTTNWSSNDFLLTLKLLRFFAISSNMCILTFTLLLKSQFLCANTHNFIILVTGLFWVSYERLSLTISTSFHHSTTLALILKTDHLLCIAIMCSLPCFESFPEDFQR